MRNRIVCTALLAFAVASLTPSSARADGAIRLTDLEPGADDGLDGLDAAVLGGALYFVGSAGSSGRGLYRYDGTAAPALVAGSVAAQPRELVAWQGRLYFLGGPGDDRELWTYDPSGPTITEALDLRPSSNGIPQRFAALPDKLCFVAFSDALGFEPHCWSGTGPAVVLDLAPGAGGSAANGLVAWQGQLAFVDESGAEGRVHLWNGTGASQEIAPGPGEPYSSACCLHPNGSELYFQAQDGDEQYRIFRHVASGAPARVSATFEPGGFLGTFRGRMITDGTDPSVGVEEPELWRRIGSAVRRVDPGAPAAGGEGHVEVAGASYFTAYPDFSSDDRDLYKYCGAGSVAPASTSFAGTDAAVVGGKAIGFQGKVYVSATDGVFGEELWQVTPDHLFCDDFETGDDGSWGSAALGSGAEP